MNFNNKKLLSLITLTLFITGCGTSSPSSKPSAWVPAQETPLAPTLTVKNIPISLPEGYNPFDTTIYQPSESKSVYELNTRQGNFTLSIINRQKNTKLIYNNQELYSGTKSAQAQMSPNGKFVAYEVDTKDSQQLYFNHHLVTSTHSGMSIWYITDEGEIKFGLEMSPCSQDELPLSQEIKTEIQNHHTSLINKYFLDNCNGYLAEFLSSDGAKKVLYNGTIFPTTSLKSFSESHNHKHYGFILSDHTRQQETLFIDGTTVTTSPFLDGIRVFNEGDWIVGKGDTYTDPANRTLHPPTRLYRNGHEFKISGDEPNSSITFNASGTAYLIATDKEWLLSDGTRITRTAGAIAELVETTVYHYFFSTSTK
jgi:PBP1b-binding outer membrane lipoprotein LpoB